MAATDDNMADYMELKKILAFTDQAALICYVIMHGVLKRFTDTTARSYAHALALHYR